MIDCGLRVTRAVAEQGFALKDLALVFITHLHSDHHLELGPLIHTAWTAGLKTPVRVWGPSGLARYWQGVLASMAEDIATRIEDEGRLDLAALVSFHAITSAPISEGPWMVDALPPIHPPLSESWSLSFRAGGRHAVFSGNTAHNPAMVGLAQGADLLIHEAMLAEGLVALQGRIVIGDERLMKH